MQSSIKTAFTKRNPKRYFKSFYMREIGPILSSIALKSRAAMTKVNISDPFLYTQFEKQLKLGKKIGILATDVIGKLNAKNLKGKNKFLQRLLKVKEEIYLETYKKANHSDEL